MLLIHYISSVGLIHFLPSYLVLRRGVKEWCK